MRVLPSAGVIAATLVGACGSGALPTDLDNFQSEIHRSIIVSPGGDSGLAAPDAVPVGQPFTASFTTQYGGCDPVYDLLVQTTNGSTITLNPLNRRVSGEICPTYVSFMTRSASVSFSAPGLDTVRAVGFLKMPDGSLQLGSIQKVIRVTP